MVQKALTDKPTMHRLKPTFFSQMTLLSNDLVFTSHWSDIYLNHGFLGYREECRKHLRKEQNRQKKNIEK